MTIDVILVSFLAVFNKIALPLLNLIVALLILLIGLILARFLKSTVLTALKAIQFDTALKELKFNTVLEKAEIKKSSAELLADLVYWLAIFLLVLGLAGSLKLPVDTALDRILSYTGIIFLAALTLSLGTFLAVLIGNLVYLAAANLGLAGAKPISKLIQYATVIFAFLLALEQLGIGPSLLQPSLGVIIGAVGLGAAIAFGLGCKDIMADFVSNLIRGK
jgi:hypothetical protein